MSVEPSLGGSAVDLTHYLRSGDTVVLGQATAEPPTLVANLIESARSVGGLTAFCGYALTSAWSGAVDVDLKVRAYGAHAAMRRLRDAGRLDLLPWHLSSIESYIRSGQLPADLVLLRVGPKDDEGYYSLGATVDYVVVAAERARAVVVEVDPYMPRPRSGRKLHESLVTAAIASRDPLPDSPSRLPSPTEIAVAAQVADLVPDGATLQLGASAVSDEIARALSARRALTVRSGLVGDWLVDLHDAGALASGPGSAVIGMALGSRRLYDFISDNDQVWMAPTHEIVAPEAIRSCPAYVTVNSAVEVDLAGAVNGEIAGGRYVGAVGGQVDFFRASRWSPGGVAVVALASTHADGSSRIVPTLAGATTSLKSDVDLVVTEWGVADLRATSFDERADRLSAVAAPEHREWLSAALSG